MSHPSHPLPTRCPVCSAGIYVEKVRCVECGAAIEGRFSNDWMPSLTREQLGFVKVFVSCRGKIKDVEEALGVSYPTVVSRLEEVADAISGQGETNRRHGQGDDRKKILDDLAAGLIDAEEAARRLRKAGSHGFR